MNYTDGFDFAMGKMAAEFAASLIPLGIFLVGVAALWAYVWWLDWSSKREKKKEERAKKPEEGWKAGYYRIPEGGAENE